MAFSCEKVTLKYAEMIFKKKKSINMHMNQNIFHMVMNVFRNALTSIYFSHKNSKKNQQRVKNKIKRFQVRKMIQIRQNGILWHVFL